ncbi:FecCD family ABC transporter permease [Treponema brennaborense]|uniref:ABC-type transporter, integral membrane subunit n=1 Tax=Treponema brennaborense (strain DSM 12168 / CIP 105900 / DD5/3) TaxID=906968 RepID=F4LNC6_TREBD|nr:iron ABC transporter permease [Treponema brennaborense]AEE17884.1 ABC-type transporter, integral membrane subunit [Treponema brennaborense DSM 12168]
MKISAPHPVRTGTSLTVRFTATALFLLAAAAAGIAFGTERIPFREIGNALFRPAAADPFAAVIVRELRLPRVLLAGLSGALLASAGAAFQGFFRNPLAESGIMGISSGAALGAVLSAFIPAATGIAGAAELASRFPQFMQANVTTVCAFCGAAAAAFLIYAASKLTARSGGTIAILLTGTAAGTFFSAVTSVVLLVKDTELHRMFVWTLGSFNGKGWSELAFVLPAAVLSAVLLAGCARFLDVLSGGERTAQALGLDPAHARLLVLTAGSLASAAAVCAGGTIGFVGLIAPHVARRLFSPRHAVLIPASMMGGAVFLITCDTAARTVAAPAEIPVGIITALAGAPFFISILFGGRNRTGNFNE